MKKIYLIRHAESEANASVDLDNPKTAKTQKHILTQNQIFALTNSPTHNFYNTVVGRILAPPASAPLPQNDAQNTKNRSRKAFFFALLFFH